jgi:hypothetical protein
MSVVTPGCVTGASVVPLVTVDESERNQARGVPQPGHPPDGLHRQTSPVRHAPQFPADCVASRPDQELS